MEHTQIGPCVVEGCEQPKYSKGWCRTHYMRQYKYGSTDDPSPEWKRFWSQVRFIPDCCWEWTAGMNQYGYGRFTLTGPRETSQKVQAHRYSYEQLVGPIPEGLVLDHLCRNRACVNPDLLEPVTLKENILRGNGMGARWARRTAALKATT